MINKWRFVIMIMVGALLMGLWGPPIQGVSAAPPSNASDVVVVSFINAPPMNMCVGDSAPVTFAYWYKGPVSGKGGSLAAFAESGTLSEGFWPLSGAKGSSRITTTYKATKAGDGLISLTSLTVALTGTTVISFNVIDCDHTVFFQAHDSVTDPSGDIDTFISGKGGIRIDENGYIDGGGTYRYILFVEYKPPKTIICDEFVESTNDATWDALGQATGDQILLSIHFDPFKLTPLIAKCVDEEGKAFDKSIIPERKVDPNPWIPLQDLTFGPNETSKDFSFGEGTGTIFLIKRQGGTK
jgi:hypothetical protein